MTTYEQFFAENPAQKEIYESEYEVFLREEKNLEGFCFITAVSNIIRSDENNKSITHN